MLLLIGATYPPGQQILHRLLEAGHVVRCLTEAPETLRSLDPAPNLMEGSLHEAETVHQALRGVSTVVHAGLTVDLPSQRAGRVIDDMGERMLIDLAVEVGIQHLLLVSSAMARRQHPVDVMRTAHAVEEYLIASEVPHTILQPAPLMETWVVRTVEPISYEGKASILGKGTNPIAFAAAADVADAVDKQLEHGPSNKRQVLRGPEALSLREVAALHESVTQERFKLSRLQRPLVRIMERIMQRANPSVGRLVTAALDLDIAPLAFADVPDAEVGTTTVEDFIRQHYANTLPGGITARS
ncbi:MAG: NAD(P)H-binding protein [Bacteroidota bacterium]